MRKIAGESDRIALSKKSVTKTRRLKCAIFLLPDVIFLLPYYARLLCNPFPCL